MTEVLYDAFDEVLNLIEAAEESGGIVEADSEKVESIILALNEQMGKELEGETEWELPFSLLDDKSQILDFPLTSLAGQNSIKIPFINSNIDEAFVADKNFYGVLFDVDESCMVYGNDPIYALSLLGENLIGISSCMSDDNSKFVLSGVEDEDGLLLKTQLIAFVYGSFDEIEEALFNFSDEIEFLSLDINTLLQIDLGDSGHTIDSLKELSDIADDFDLKTIADEVKSSLELVGKETLQFSQLQRFLDICGLIKDEDTTKLGDFFKGLYKGEVYSGEVKSSDISEEKVKKGTETVTEITTDNTQMNEHIEGILQNMFEQQYKALDFVETSKDLDRVKYILSKMRKYLKEIPSDFDTKEDVKNFIAKELGKEVVEVKEEIPVEKEEKTLRVEKEVVIEKEEKLASKEEVVKEETPKQETKMKVVSKADVAPKKEQEKKHL